MTRAFGRWGWAVCALVAAGCGGPSGPPRPRTGAEETVRAYFEALARADYPSAYQVLDADSKGRCGADPFARLGRAYRQNLGFDPTEVHVQACDERGDQAIAHVTLKGLSGSSPQFHKDAVGLRRGPGGWAVQLPADFGKPPPKR
jgi:hypothetical protein